MSAEQLAGVVATLRSAGCVFAEDEAALLISEAGSPAELADMVERRVAGLPLEHILGWVEFCGLRMAVDPSVFVPRRRTEFLVRQAVSVEARRIANRRSSSTCAAGVRPSARRSSPCSAGAICTRPISTLPRCARRGRTLDTVGGLAYIGDLYDPLPKALRRRVDLLVVNAPYVPTDAIALMPPEARLYEAPVALDGGADGLEVQRRVIAEALSWLAPQGRLMIETSRRQAASTVELVERAGMLARVARCEEVDATVVVGTHR